MKITTILALIIFTNISFTEDYQCRKIDGCEASITHNGIQRRVIFRKGDVVGTESGWVIKPDDGWVEIDKIFPNDPALAGLIINVV